MCCPYGAIFSNDIFLLPMCCPYGAMAINWYIIITMQLVQWCLVMLTLDPGLPPFPKSLAQPRRGCISVAIKLWDCTLPRRGNISVTVSLWMVYMHVSHLHRSIISNVHRRFVLQTATQTVSMAGFHNRCVAPTGQFSQTIFFCYRCVAPTGQWRLIDT